MLWAKWRQNDKYKLSHCWEIRVCFLSTESWQRPQPTREQVAYVTSSIICWDRSRATRDSAQETYNEQQYLCYVTVEQGSFWGWNQPTTLHCNDVCPGLSLYLEWSIGANELQVDKVNKTLTRWKKINGPFASEIRVCYQTRCMLLLFKYFSFRILCVWYWHSKYISAWHKLAVVGWKMFLYNSLS